ncbi:MAG: hypothetical protein ACBZ72_02050 [Candidatus Bathyarchaeia archaeon]|jgi:hypothetical protein
MKQDGGDCQKKTNTFWGYSEKVPNTTGKKPAYLPPISIQITIHCRTYRGVGRHASFAGESVEGEGSTRNVAYLPWADLQ